MSEIVKDKEAFATEARGYRFVATYLHEPKGDALVEIGKDGQVVRSFLWPAYKIWNIAAHADDIAAGFEEDGEIGLRVAGATGFGGYVVPREVASDA